MCDENKVDVIVVGAGLAGLACAWVLGGAGLEVLVLERGDAPGTKNLTGGRLYLKALRALEPELMEGLPLERTVCRESLCLLSEGSSTTVTYRGDTLAEEPAHSATVLRGRLDAHLGDACAERGAFVIPSTPVRELLREGQRVRGVVAGEERFTADAVVLADGALSFLGEQAGLHEPVQGEHFAVGVKEVLALPRETIEDRFQLEGEQGEARLFLGSISGGQVGGGFLYTNRQSLSLGLVLGLEAYRSGALQQGSAQLLEAFKQRPEIRPLVKGAQLVEYSAHLVPEGGLDAAPAAVGDGVLAVGDAAGLCLNHGLTVRGMDLALASGVLAGRAILKAKQAGDFSAAGLAVYQQLLDESFVGRDMATFRAAPAALARQRWYQHYPGAVNALLEELFLFDDGPKERLFSTAWRHLRRDFIGRKGLSDAWEARRL